MNGLQLNGQYVSATDFEQRSPLIVQLLADLPLLEQKAIIDFLQQWFDAEKNTITAQTSGSTGPPKTITLKKSQLLASATATANYFGFKAGQRALLPLSARFIAGKMMLVRAIYSGFQLDVRPANHIFPNPNNLPFYDFAVMVPVQLSRVIEENYLACFGQLLLGGADIPPLLKTQLLQVDLPVFQGFGMTETVSHIALRKVSGSSPEKAYTVLDGVQIRTDERQCLCIKGPATDDEWVISNDVVELQNDRQFVWRGRYDHVINSGGIKVVLEEVEAALGALIAAESNLACLQNREFALSRMPDPRYGESIALWVTGEVPAEHERVDCLRKLKASLPLAWAPRAILAIDRLPLLENGKLDRRALSHLM